MGKGSGGSRTVDKTHKGRELVLSKGKYNAEITDDVKDFYLTDSIRKSISNISVSSYNDLKSQLAKHGIELETDSSALKGERAGENIAAISETGTTILSAIETYKSVFGEKSLSKLKKIKLIDNDLDEPGAYHYNAIGENDPMAGTLRIRSAKSLGARTMFHEFAHVMQDSYAKKGEDAVTYSERVLNGFGNSFKAYYGAAKSALAAEQFADAIANGFAFGSNQNIELIKYIRKNR